LKYVLRRLGFFVLTLWTCVTVNFVLPRLMPGSPALALMAKYKGRLSVASLKALEVAFGINTHQSEISQYFSYLGNTVRGRFGVSFSLFPESVSRVVLNALPWTLGLVGLTTVISFILGTFLGIFSAWRRGGLVDSVATPSFIVLSAFPYYWIALMAQLAFAISLHWMPLAFGYDQGGRIGFSWSFVVQVLHHGLLPALTILITSVGGWILTMRNNMVTTLADDYVRMARAKGLSPLRIMLDYAGRNAVLPNLSGFAMSLGFVVSGAVLVEYVFNYPGVGYMLLSAVTSQDYPLMQALFLLITVAVLLAILAMDLLTVIMDPRTRVQA